MKKPNHTADLLMIFVKILRRGLGQQPVDTLSLGQDLHGPLLGQRKTSERPNRVKNSQEPTSTSTARRPKWLQSFSSHNTRITIYGQTQSRVSSLKNLQGFLAMAHVWLWLPNFGSMHQLLALELNCETGETSCKLSPTMDMMRR